MEVMPLLDALAQETVNFFQFKVVNTYYIRMLTLNMTRNWKHLTSL